MSAEAATSTAKSAKSTELAPFTYVNDMEQYDPVRGVVAVCSYLVTWVASLASPFIIAGLVACGRWLEGLALAVLAVMAYLPVWPTRVPSMCSFYQRGNVSYYRESSLRYEEPFMNPDAEVRRSTKQPLHHLVSSAPTRFDDDRIQQSQVVSLSFLSLSRASPSLSLTPQMRNTRGIPRNYCMPPRARPGPTQTLVRPSARHLRHGLVHPLRPRGGARLPLLHVHGALPEPLHARAPAHDGVPGGGGQGHVPVAHAQEGSHGSAPGGLRGGDHHERHGPPRLPQEPHGLHQVRPPARVQHRSSL